MTLQRKPHKLIKRAGLAAALPSDAAVDPPAGNPIGGGGNGGNSSPGNGNNGNPDPAGSGVGGGGAGGGASQSTPPPSSNTPSRPTPSQEPSSPSTTPPAAAPTPSSTSSPPTSTLPSTTSDSSSTLSSSSTTSTSSDSQTSTSTHTFILTAPAQTNTRVSTFTPVSVSSASHSPSATAAPSASSGVKVGSIVGGIAGGLVGIAVLGILISFILRRLRKRNHRDTIIGDDFRRSEFLGSNTPINDPPLQPPSMAQFNRDSTSSPGLAGQGAYRGVYSDNPSTPYAAGRHAVPDWGANAGVGAAGAAASRHDYGQHQAEDVDDISHGIYSSQPQQQMVYNPEAYGSYAAYGQDSHAATGGYQEATREYQGQKAYNGGGYSGQEFGGASYGVAVADPTQSSSVAGAHPSTLTPALRDQSNVSKNRQENARSVVQDDDVYGGI